MNLKKLWLLNIVLFIALWGNAQNGWINITFKVTKSGPNPYTGHCEVRKVSDNTLVKSKDWTGGETPVTMASIPPATGGTYKVLITPNGAGYINLPASATVTSAVVANQGTSINVTIQYDPNTINGWINITFTVTNSGPNPYTGHCDVRKVSDNTIVQSRDWTGGESPVTMSSIPPATGGTYKVLITPNGAGYINLPATAIVSDAVVANQGTSVNVNIQYAE